MSEDDSKTNSKTVSGLRDNPIGDGGSLGVRNDDPSSMRTRQDGKSRQAFRGRDRG